jgi:hypothetical protein
MRRSSWIWGQARARWRRLLDRFPGASVVAVDFDPVLLALGRAADGDRAGLRFVDADLADQPGQ